MPSLGITSKMELLNQGYVFYRSLLESGSKQSRFIGSNALGHFDEMFTDEVSLHIVNQLYTMARREGQKEQALLKKYFGEEIHFDPEDENFYLNLTNLINLNLQTKAIFERYRNKMMYNSGEISITTHYETYFKKALNEYLDRIESTAKTLMENNEKMGFTDAVAEAYKSFLPEIVHTSVGKLLESKDTNEKEVIQGYKEILDAFNNNTLDSAEFEKQLRKIYRLDDIEEYIKNAADKKSSTIDQNKLAIKFGKSLRYQGGGISFEYLEQMVVNHLLKSKNLNISVDTHHTGHFNIRPDNTIVFGELGEIVEESFNKLKVGSSRADAIEAAAEISERMKNFSDGFIVYISDKTAVQNSGFKARGGFKGGEDVSLDTLGNDVLANVMDTGVLMSAIGSTIKGGLLDDDAYRERLSDVVAANMAYLLFDDVNTLGLPQPGAQTLHLFNLNSIYIPLSLLLFYLAQAFEKAESDRTELRKLAAVNIKYTGEAKKKLYEPGEDSGMDKWRMQRDVAQRDIKIGFNFLRSLSEIVTKLNPNYR